ncbi:MAG: phage holin family protein [Oscillospiraceae bacterium]|nr:phage holin family protein [Oscillospiraceae bacterium]
MKEHLCMITGLFGSLIAGLFGGWDASMVSLMIFMGVDYATGLIVAAIGKSPKTESGSLKSEVGWRGLAKKCVVLLLILVAVRLDITLQTNYIRDAVCIAFMANELISIIENAGILGVPIPNAVKNAIEILKNKGENKND